MPITTEQKASSVAHIRETEGFTPVERAQLDARSEAEIEHGAQNDPDAALASPEALKRAVAKRRRRQGTEKVTV